MQRECKKHGTQRHRPRSDGGYRCTKCRNEQISKWRRKIKLKAVEYHGGKCRTCGYSKCVEALEFHHLTDKDFIVSSGSTKSWDTVKKELDKCHMLCANCHREVHVKER